MIARDAPKELGAQTLDLIGAGAGQRRVAHRVQIGLDESLAQNTHFQIGVRHRFEDDGARSDQRHGAVQAMPAPRQKTQKL